MSRMHDSVAGWPRGGRGIDGDARLKPRLPASSMHIAILDLASGGAAARPLALLRALGRLAFDARVGRQGGCGQGCEE